MEKKTKIIIGVLIAIVIIFLAAEVIGPTLYVWKTGEIPKPYEPDVTITIVPNDDNNTLLVTGVEYSNLGWENVNISVSGPSIVYYNWINLTRVSGYPYSIIGLHAPGLWSAITTGDEIQVGKYDVPITVTLRWLPTNKIFGPYNFLT
jgi:hypothetical protein